MGVASRLVGHVVDVVGFVQFAVGVGHGSVVSLMGETLFLQLSLFVAIPADDVGVPGVAVAGLSVVVGRAIVLLGQKPVAVSLGLDFLLSEIFPDDFASFFKVGLNSGDLVQPFVVVLDSLQVAGCLHAFIEGSFLGLQDLVADAILKPSKEELMLDKVEDIGDAFGFSFLNSRSDCSDSSHGSGLVVSEVLVGHLDPVGVVID